MGRARRDDNWIPSLIGVSATDGETPIEIYADATTKRLYVNALLAAGTSVVGTVDVRDISSGTQTNDVKITLDGESVGVNLNALTTVYNGQKTISSAGTQEALASSTTIKSVTIKALAANTNNVYVGDSSVSSSNGFVLVAGESISLDVANLATVYIDVDTNDEGVSYIALN